MASKQKPAFKCVGIVIKQNVPEANELALKAAQFLKQKEISVAFAMESQEVCELAMGESCSTKEALVRRCDLILVLGGDGTFISVARLMSTRSIPLLGVNLGQLGFLTEVKKTELMEALELALQEKLSVDERTMLECQVSRKNKTILKNAVVNDVVVSKGAIARIFDMQVSIDDKSVAHIKGDGLIISSPTGSTAYCLAAGGPIVEPNVPAMALIAICPHSLTLRPVIVPDTSRVTIVPHYRSGTVVLTLDGQTSIELEPGDEVRVTKFTKHCLKILHWPKRDYFALLREKLKYGYRD